MRLNYNEHFYSEYQTYSGSSGLWIKKFLENRFRDLDSVLLDANKYSFPGESVWFLQLADGWTWAKEYDHHLLIKETLSRVLITICKTFKQTKKLIEAKRKEAT